MEMKSESNIISLGNLREKHKKKIRKQYLEPEIRIAELEEDLLRVIDLALELEERLFRQERYLGKLTELLKREASTQKP